MKVSELNYEELVINYAVTCNQYNSIYAQKKELEEEMQRRLRMKQEANRK